MTKLVLASNNLGKVKEIQEMLATSNIELRSQSEFQISEIEETGLSFVENAILKARNACAQTGLPAIADDSGIEVDFLKGAPGIYSARYAGVDASDEANLQKLLKALDQTPNGERQARFQCVMVYMAHENDPTPIICQGTWEGEIARTKSGENGFGYDPIFWQPQFNCSSADLSSAQKNQLSHRGQALSQLVEAITARAI